MVTLPNDKTLIAVLITVQITAINVKYKAADSDYSDVYYNLTSIKV